MTVAVHINLHDMHLPTVKQVAKGLKHSTPTFLKITNLLVMFLATLGFGAGFFSLLSANDAIRGAVPMERLGASVLLVVSFFLLITSCAGYQSVVTHNYVLLFLYFTFNVLLYTLTICTAVAVWVDLPNVASQIRHFCESHAKQFPSCQDDLPALKLEVEDHLSTVLQASFSIALVLLANMLAAFGVMGSVPKPTLHGQRGGFHYARDPLGGSPRAMSQADPVEDWDYDVGAIHDFGIGPSRADSPTGLPVGALSGSLAAARAARAVKRDLEQPLVQAGSDSD
ncbi:unnamed protein product [Pedinophyceae sp. YPF-701]|nr:unnamed protein product [Pedinophyceae sp. YPF-701]